jgi:mannose-6-phosphate isomerase-like protein (cupin superfamily)
MSCGTCTACAALPDELQPYGVEHATADGIFVKQMVIPKAGTIVPTHAHSYDHTTMVAKGSVDVWADGVFQRRYDAPEAIYIPALVKHRIVSLVDDCICYCIHRMRDGGAAVHEEHQIVGEV